MLAIGPEMNAGIRYLRSEDAAICVNNRKMIQQQVQRLIDHPELVHAYANKACDCARRNHDPDIVRAKLKRELETLVSKETEDNRNAE